MNSLINLQKPLFEYSDLELKAIAFDESQLLKIHEKNITLILSELERRRLSTIVAHVNNDQINEVFNNQQNR
jgi:hypothetical protein